MKTWCLIIQIPAYNEAAQIGGVLQALPRKLPGVDRVEVVVVDDGSTDATAKVAKEAGATVLSLAQHRGLARAFSAGIAFSLERGADWVVTIDADHQYDPNSLPALLSPLQRDLADVVVGVRPRCNPNYSSTTRVCHWIGCRAMSLVSGLPLRDPPSGFRAYTRNAAQRLTVTDPFTYTLETLIQLRPRGLRLAEVPVGVFPVRRPSRLFRSVPEYLGRSILTMGRSAIRYRPGWVAGGMSWVGGVLTLGLTASHPLGLTLGGLGIASLSGAAWWTWNRRRTESPKPLPAIAGVTHPT